MQMLEVAARTMYAAELNWVTQWYGGTFRTVDGVVTVLGLFRNNAVQLICDALGIPDLSRRPELATTELQARNKEVVNEVIAPIVAQLSTEDALGRFDEVNLLCAPQLALDQALQHPQIAANDLLVDVEVAGQGPAQVVGYPVRLSRGRGAVRHEVPRVGEHTAQVLADLGYRPEQISEFCADGAIRIADHERADAHAHNYL